MRLKVLTRISFPKYPLRENIPANCIADRRLMPRLGTPWHKSGGLGADSKQNQPKYSISKTPSLALIILTVFLLSLPIDMSYIPCLGSTCLSDVQRRAFAHGGLALWMDVERCLKMVSKCKLFYISRIIHILLDIPREPVISTLW